MDPQENTSLDTNHNPQVKLQNASALCGASVVTADQGPHAVLPTTNHTNPQAVGDPRFQMTPVLFGRDFRATDLLMQVLVSTESYKAKINNVAMAAADELIHMACALEPLWIYDDDKEIDIMNVEEYRRRFEPLSSSLEDIIKLMSSAAEPLEMLAKDYANVEGEERGDRPPMTSTLGNVEASLQIEASRATGIVLMHPLNIVDLFMDIEQWALVFNNIVSKATISGLLSTGEGLGNPNGALQVMMAELHMASPLIETREMYFARYCKQLDAVNVWIVVDISLESIFPNLAIKCQRKPSGCLIQGLENGLSKVTWVEHNKVGHSHAHHIFRQLITSGFVFSSAKHWVTTLERQCWRLKVLVEDDNRARKSVMQLSHRISMSYHAAFGIHKWMPLTTTNAMDIFVKTSFNVDDPGNPRGVIITLSTSVRLPVAANNIFELLRCGNQRNKWDILCHGCETRDLAHFPTGRDQSSRVSIVLVEPLAKKKKKKSVMFYVQESYTDATGHYVVYAPVDDSTLKALLKGESCERVAILGSGFTILPERGIEKGLEAAGSILTLLFQITDEHLSSPEYLPPQLVATLHNLISGTISKILDCLGTNIGF